MPAPSIEKIVKVITQALSDDKRFSVSEAMDLVSGATLGPTFEKSEYEAVNTVYQHIVSGKVSADNGVAKILKDKLDGGFVEDSSNRSSDLKVAGFSVGGAGIGAMIAALIAFLSGPIVIGVLLLWVGIGAGIGALIGFGIGSIWHSGE